MCSSGRLLCTLIRTLKPAGTHRSWPEPTVTTVLSRTPPEARRDSGMRYQHTTTCSRQRAARTQDVVVQGGSNTDRTLVVPSFVRRARILPVESGRFLSVPAGYKVRISSRPLPRGTWTARPACLDFTRPKRVCGTYTIEGLSYTMPRRHPVASRRGVGTRRTPPRRLRRISRGHHPSCARMSPAIRWHKGVDLRRLLSSR